VTLQARLKTCCRAFLIPACVWAANQQAQLSKLQLATTLKNMKTILALTFACLLTGCGTILAVADGVGTIAVYGVKTVVNTVDAITPDIVNKDRD
jgi:hypothetical protein